MMNKDTPATSDHTPSEQEVSGILELMSVMGQDFAQSRDINATLERGLQRIIDFVGAEGGALFMLEEDGKVLHCTSCIGGTDIVGLKLNSDEGIVGRSVQTNIGEIVRDVSKDPNFHTAVDEETGFTTRSILCAPMSVKDERIGAIELVNKKSGDGLFEDDDLHLLQSLSSSAALAILNARMAEALVEQERVRRELELAAEIQRSLLPDEQEDDFPVHGVNRPARTVSGDFYDFFSLDDGRICFNLGDVSGKGMNAALLMAKTASLFRCLGKTIHEPGMLMARVNDEICETATRGMFVTMVGGIYDPETNVVKLANAGHEPPLLFAQDGTCRDLPADAPPLGIMPMLSPDEGFPEEEINLDGGSLYIFTDGVTEGYVEDGSEFGVEGLIDLIKEKRKETPSERLKAVVSKFSHEGVSLRDDLTLLVLESAVKSRDNSEAPVLHMDFPSHPEQLKAIRKAVFETVQSLGLPEEPSFDVVIAIDEACQNIIRHAYKGAKDGDVALDIFHRGDDIIFELRDFAEKIDPTKVKPRDLGDVKPGGLGTHFIREIMDEVDFVPPPDNTGNLLRLVKRIE